jgi:hypothetical protein
VVSERTLHFLLRVLAGSLEGFPTPPPLRLACRWYLRAVLRKVCGGGCEKFTSRNSFAAAKKPGKKEKEEEEPEKKPATKKAQAAAMRADPDALRTVIQEIEKAHGKGSMIQLGGRLPDAEAEAISTGSIALDAAIGIGGVPRGRITEIFGPESSGKTSLALHVIASAQRMGGNATFIDAEHALDPVYARNLGVDLNRLYVSQPDTGEQALEIADTLVRSGTMDVVVIDSVAALVYYLSSRAFASSLAFRCLGWSWKVKWAPRMSALKPASCLMYRSSSGSVSTYAHANKCRRFASLRAASERLVGFVSALASPRTRRRLFSSTKFA